MKYSKEDIKKIIQENKDKIRIVCPMNGGFLKIGDVNERSDYYDETAFGNPVERGGFYCHRD